MYDSVKKMVFGGVEQKVVDPWFDFASIESTNQLIAMLDRNEPGIVRLDLSAMKTEQRIEDVLSVLRFNKVVRHLKVKLSEDHRYSAIQGIAELLATNKIIRIFDISQSHISDEEGKLIITHGLNRNSFLLSLNMSANNMASQSSQYMIEYLSRNNVIAHIDVKDNNFGVQELGLLNNVIGMKQNICSASCGGWLNNYGSLLNRRSLIAKEQVESWKHWFGDPTHSAPSLLDVVMHQTYSSAIALKLYQEDCILGEEFESYLGKIVVALNNVAKGCNTKAGDGKEEVVISTFAALLNSIDFSNGGYTGVAKL